MKRVLLLSLTVSVLHGSVNAASVVVYPAPAGENLCREYKVQVEGQDVPVYIAKVAPENPELRWKAMDDKARSAEFFETASFAYFDMNGSVKVTVTCPEEVRSAKLLPASLKLTHSIEGRTVSFHLAEPKPVTLEVNGRWTKALHVFANSPEKDAPRPGDPNVVYFGPGIHEITHLVVSNSQAVYVAGGAVVRAVIGADEPYQISTYSGLKTYAPSIVLKGTNITLRGRGIIDGSGCTTHAKNLVHMQGKDLHLEGVILRDSSTWTVPVRRSERVHIDNVKLLGYRANADGIDICNSREVLVENCFIRTLDDLIVVKTDRGQGQAGKIVARNCVLWNEVAHALSIGAELREDVDDVLFTDCDVIHDKGREWTLRIYHCDSAKISNVQFQNLRIEESPRLISLWIDKAFWTRDAERGHIDNVTFRNIDATASPLRVELKGFDADHAIENVAFDNVTVNGKPLRPEDIQKNEFVRRVSLRP